MSSPSLKEKDVEAHAAPAESEKGEITDLSPRNADEALTFLQHEGTVRAMTEEDEKKLRRKIDWMIMPLMFCCYCLQYLDKTLINYANVMVSELDVLCQALRIPRDRPETPSRQD